MYAHPQVMASLQALARNGRTVVCSIHQPRSSIYTMIDCLCLMTQGKCAYFGPAGEAVQRYARTEARTPRRGAHRSPYLPR